MRASSLRKQTMLVRVPLSVYFYVAQADERTLAVAVRTVFARVICALFVSILAAEKSGCVKYADFFGGGLDLGFILV